MEENLFERYIDYEAKMMQIFSELQLKPNQCQLIRALLIASKGQTEFEVSYTELSSYIVKMGEGKAGVNYALKTLLNWQEKSKMELIRVLSNGKRIRNGKGEFVYLKPKYKLVLLEDLAKVLHSESEKFDSALEDLLEKIKERYQPMAKGRKYHPLHKLRKARKTIETKIKRVFELSKAAGLNPISECKRVLDNALKILKGLEAEETERENREKFIAEFESLLGTMETDEELEAVTQ